MNKSVEKKQKKEIGKPYKCYQNAYLLQTNKNPSFDDFRIR